MEEDDLVPTDIVSPSPERIGPRNILSPSPERLVPTDMVSPSPERLLPTDMVSPSPERLDANERRGSQEELVPTDDGDYASGDEAQENQPSIVDLGYFNDLRMALSDCEDEPMQDEPMQDESMQDDPMQDDPTMQADENDGSTEPPSPAVPLDEEDHPASSPMGDQDTRSSVDAETIVDRAAEHLSSFLSDGQVQSAAEDPSHAALPPEESPASLSSQQTLEQREAAILSRAKAALEVQQDQMLDPQLIAKIRGAYGRSTTEPTDMQHIASVQHLYGFSLTQEELQCFFANHNQGSRGRVTYAEYFEMMKSMALASRLQWEYSENQSGPAATAVGAATVDSAASATQVEATASREAAGEEAALDEPASADGAEATAHEAAGEEVAPEEGMSEDAAAPVEPAKGTSISFEIPPEAIMLFDKLQERLLKEKDPLDIRWDGADMLIDSKVRIKHPYDTKSCSAERSDPTSQRVLKTVINRLAFMRAMMKTSSGSAGAPARVSLTPSGSMQAPSTPGAIPPGTPTGQLWDDGAADDDEVGREQSAASAHDAEGEDLAAAIEQSEQHEVGLEAEMEMQNVILASGVDEGELEAFAELASQRNSLRIRDEEVPMELQHASTWQAHDTAEVRSPHLDAEAWDSWDTDDAASSAGTAADGAVAAEDAEISTPSQSRMTSLELGARAKASPAPRSLHSVEPIRVGLRGRLNGRRPEEMTRPSMHEEQADLHPDQQPSPSSAHVVAAESRTEQVAPIQSKSAGAGPRNPAEMTLSAATSKSASKANGSAAMFAPEGKAASSSKAAGALALPKPPGPPPDPSAAFTRPIEMMHPPPRAEGTPTLEDSKVAAPTSVQVAAPTSQAQQAVQQPVHSTLNGLAPHGSLQATAAAAALPQRPKVTADVIGYHRRLQEVADYYRRCLDNVAGQLNALYSAYQCSPKDFPPHENAWQQWTGSPFTQMAASTASSTSSMSAAPSSPAARWPVVVQHQQGQTSQLQQQAATWAAPGVGQWNSQLQQQQAQAAQLRQALQMQQQQAQARAQSAQPSSQPEMPPPAAPAVQPADEVPAPPPEQPPPPEETPPPPPPPSATSQETPPPPPPETLPEVTCLEIRSGSNDAAASSVSQVQSKDAACAQALLEAFDFSVDSPAASVVAEEAPPWKRRRTARALPPSPYVNGTNGKAPPAATPPATPKAPSAVQPTAPAAVPRHCSVCSTCKSTTKKNFKGRRWGILCERLKNGVRTGCGLAVCWRCMHRTNGGVHCCHNRLLRDMNRDLDDAACRCGGPRLGWMRTTLPKCAQVGPDYWWMHEQCMTEEDRRDFRAAANFEQFRDREDDPGERSDGWQSDGGWSGGGCSAGDWADNRGNSPEQT